MTDNIETATITNPRTQNIIKVRYALSLPHDHPAYILARQKFPAHVPEEAPEVAKNRRQADTRNIALSAMQNARQSSRMDDIEEFGQTYLNGVNPVDIAAEYLDLLDVHNQDEISSMYIYISTEMGTPRSIAIKLSLTDGSDVWRQIKVSSEKPPVIVHKLFSTSQRSTVGKGLAKKMLRGSLDLADRIGATSIQFEAGLDSGGYTWAKYGGILNPADRYGILGGITNKLTSPEAPMAYLERAGDRMLNNARDAFIDWKSFVRRGTISKKQARSTLITIYNIYKAGMGFKKVVEEARKFMQENPDDVAILAQLVKANIDNYTDTTNLMYMLAHHPLGKYLLLNDGWNGYFDTRPDSLGRKNLENSLEDNPSQKSTT